MRLHDLVSQALHALDPEDAHRAAILGLKMGLGPRDLEEDDPVLRTTIAGIDIPNCVGLAAGFDKDAEVANAMLGAGFGFVECGTVTPMAQVGNPRPRLFRLSQDRAVINRMGFNNKGLEAYAARLGARRRKVGVVGANIGANKDAVDRVTDYVVGLEKVAGLCDYITVNVSSPNTPGLRALQTRAALDDLLGRLADVRSSMSDCPPVLLKVAPDLEVEEPAEITAAVRRHGFDGIIVSNTTIARPASLRSSQAGQVGGLSGAPLLAQSTDMLRAFRQVDASLPLIGVGGIATGADAYAKIRAGADAVQLYSALVFNGPSLVRQIKRDLARLIRAEGFTSVADARG